MSNGSQAADERLESLLKSLWEADIATVGGITSELSALVISNLRLQRRIPDDYAVRLLQKAVDIREELPRFALTFGLNELLKIAPHLTTSLLESGKPNASYLIL